MKKQLLAGVFCAGVFLLGLVSTAQSALILQNAGDEVLDTTTSLIWMQDFNIATGAGAVAQNAWAAGLTYAGNSDWRLPSHADVTAFTPLYGDFALLSEFTNVSPTANYWTSNCCPQGKAWLFNSSGNLQFITSSNQSGGVGVRDQIASDVAFSAVPTPSALLLMASGLVGLVAIRRWTGRIG